MKVLIFSVSLKLLFIIFGILFLVRFKMNQDYKIVVCYVYTWIESCYLETDTYAESESRRKLQVRFLSALRHEQ